MDSWPTARETEEGISELVACRVATNPRDTHSKAIYKIENTPSDYNIVVDGDEKRNDARRDADAAQPGMDCVPHAQSAQSHPLTHAEFNQEQRDAF